jgi:hypothetical protein
MVRCDFPVVLDAQTAAYLQNPRDTETAAHIAFTHVWALNEGARRESLSATMTEGIVLSRKYFAVASRLAPDDGCWLLRMSAFQATELREWVAIHSFP